MGSIMSPSDAINKLQIEPFPTKKTQMKSLIRSGSVIVGIGIQGTIYSNRFERKYCYVGPWELPEDLLKCFVTLGIATQDDVKKHNDIAKSRAMKRNAKYIANNLRDNMKEYGANSPNELLKKVEALIPTDAP